MEDQKCNPSGDDETIELRDGVVLPVLHEDAHCLILDKPVGFECGAGGAGSPARPPQPDLAQILTAEVAATAAWVRARSMGLAAVVGCLEAEAAGPIIVAKSKKAAHAYARLLEDRRTHCEFLAVVGGKPPRRRWTRCLKLRPDPALPGRMLTDTTQGQFAETDFEVLAHDEGMVLILARPRTPRWHQVRVHLAATGIPVLGDTLYGFGRDLPRQGQRDHIVSRTAPPLARGDDPSPGAPRQRLPPLGLRGVRLAFRCPFTGATVDVMAPADEFLEQFGFEFNADDEPPDPRDDTGPVHPEDT